MRIYTKAGDLPFKFSEFPDGQPHFTLDACDREFDAVTIETAIPSPRRLFEVCLATQVLRNQGYSIVNLDVRYLMGARMDRTINSFQPFTLQTVASIINSLGFAQVRILDVHSETATRLIRNSSNVLPYHAVTMVRQNFPDALICAPDKGALDRVTKLAGYPNVVGKKVRNPDTGILSDFNISGDVMGKKVLIIDDICDGGATFIGLSKALRAKGAVEVHLFVTHGLFTRGQAFLLEHLNSIHTTDSWYEGYVENEVTVIPVNMEKM